MSNLDILNNRPISFGKWGQVVWEHAKITSIASFFSRGQSPFLAKKSGWIFRNPLLLLSSSSLFRKCVKKKQKRTTWRSFSAHKRHSLVWTRIFGSCLIRKLLSWTARRIAQPRTCPARNTRTLSGELSNTLITPLNFGPLNFGHLLFCDP